MAAAEFPPEVDGLLGRLRERLAGREDVVGAYVGGETAHAAGRACQHGPHACRLRKSRAAD